MKRSDIMNFFSDGLSVDESRISIIMLSFLVCLGFALWQFATTGTIDGSMQTLLAYQIGAITGMNVVEKFTNRNDIGE